MKQIESALLDSLTRKARESPVSGLMSTFISKQRFMVPAEGGNQQGHASPLAQA